MRNVFAFPLYSNFLKYFLVSTIDHFKTKFNKKTNKSKRFAEYTIHNSGKIWNFIQISRRSSGSNLFLI